MTERLCLNCQTPLNPSKRGQHRDRPALYCNKACFDAHVAARAAARRAEQLAERRFCPVCHMPYGPMNHDGRFKFNQTCAATECVSRFKYWKNAGCMPGEPDWPEVTGPIAFAPLAFADNVDDGPVLGRLPMQPVTFKPRASIQ